MVRLTTIPEKQRKCIANEKMRTQRTFKKTEKIISNLFQN